jgi:multicomponent Na+:H+ antiporter subunit B
MNNRGILRQLAAFLLVAAVAAALYLALHDARPGRRLFSAPLEERVSWLYLYGRTGEAAFPESANPARPNGAANIVTAVVVDYRLMDTFGEILVLFAAGAGVALLMERRGRRSVLEASIIVRTAVPMIMLFALVVGFYIVLHGHLSPGGGFAGGAVLASAFVLRFLAFPKRAGVRWFKVLETCAGLGIVAYGLIGLVREGSFFANFLPPGSPGATLSAYGIMIVYALIGAKVASELSSIAVDFISPREKGD